MKKQAFAVCSSCGGTGVYSGMCEGKGNAVICLGCDGTGGAWIEWTPFVRRRRRHDIRWVSQSRGSFLATGVGAVGKRISYREFLKGKRPQP